MKKITINYLQNKYWYQPSLITASRSRWVALPYKSFTELITKYNFELTPLHVSINKDVNFKHYNNAARARQCEELIITDSIIEHVKQNGSVLVEFLPNILVEWNTTAFKLMQNGWFFSYPKEQWEKWNNSYKNIYIYQWSKQGFIIKKHIPA